MSRRGPWPARIAWAAGLIAATAGLGGLMSLSGLWSRRLDVFSHLAPVWGVLGIAAVVLWLIAGRPGRVLPAVGLIEIACCVVLMGPELLAAARPKPAVPAGAERLKVLQFNVWKANVDVEATLAYIRASGADVVTLQEVVGAMADAPARLLEAYPYQASHRGQNAYTTTILSKRPMLSWEPLRIASGLRATFATASGAPFEVASTHYLWPTDLGQMGQREHLADQIAAMDQASVILTGDMNLTPWSFTLRRQDRLLKIERRTRAVWSWPARLSPQIASPLPLLPIDQVYAGAAWKTLSVTRGPRLGSDHYPVLVELAWSPTP